MNHWHSGGRRPILTSVTIAGSKKSPQNTHAQKLGSRMAALWFDAVEITFHPVGAPLSRWKAVMAARMQYGNFTGVVTNDAEVAGGRSGGWTSVAPLHKRDLGGSRLILSWQRARPLQSCSSAPAELRLDLLRCSGISFLHFWRLLIRQPECRPFKEKLWAELVAC